MRKLRRFQLRTPSSQVLDFQRIHRCWLRKKYMYVKHQVGNKCWCLKGVNGCKRVEGIQNGWKQWKVVKMDSSGQERVVWVGKVRYGSKTLAVGWRRAPGLSMKLSSAWMDALANITHQFRASLQLFLYVFLGEPSSWGYRRAGILKLEYKWSNERLMSRYSR